MKTILIIASAILLHSCCEATFGGHGSGNIGLSGNFHGLLSHPLLGKKPAAVAEPAVVIPEAPVVIPEPVAPVASSGFSLGGNIHGLFKNHRLLSGFHGKKEQAIPAAIVEVPVTEAPFVAPAPVVASNGHGFSLKGSLHGILKNHRLLGAFHKKPVGAAPAAAPAPELSFDNEDNTGYSVSSSNSEVVPEVVPEYIAPETTSSFSEASSFSESSNTFSEVNEIPQPVYDAPIAPAPVAAPAATGSASFSLSGGHNIHKVLGDVVGLKVKLLQQVQNGISGSFDNHIRNLDKLAGHFNKNSAGSSSSSLHGGFSLHGNRY